MERERDRKKQIARERERDNKKKEERKMEVV